MDYFFIADRQACFVGAWRSHSSGSYDSIYINAVFMRSFFQCGPVVRALGLHAAAPGLNPVITSGLDLFPVVPDSTLPCFVNSQLVASCQLGFLICFC